MSGNMGTLNYGEVWRFSGFHAGLKKMVCKFVFGMFGGFLKVRKISVFKCREGQRFSDFHKCLKKLVYPFMIGMLGGF